MTQLHDDLTLAHEVLSRLVALMDTTDRDGRNLEARIIDGYRGHPKAASYDSDKVTSSGSSDPTGNAALSRATAEADHKLLKARTRDLLELVLRMERIGSAYTPRPATDKERREVDGANDPGCTSCSRTDASSGVARWEPQHRDGLCRWCYRWRLDCGELPTLVELVRHHNGERLKRPA